MPSTASTLSAGESNTARTRIKICGLRQPEHVAAAVDAGADAIGFVCYPPSVRAVDLASMAALIARVPAFVQTVALFVNPSESEVQQVLAETGVNLLQFHGSESEAFCKSFKRPYVKALAVAPGFDSLQSSHQYASASALLLDTPSAGHGGSGKTFEWQLLDQPQQDSPSADVLPLVLSGGLTAANVASAIKTVRPYAVDVSSGVESSRGVKDATLIYQFCRAVRVADNA